MTRARCIWPLRSDCHASPSFPLANALVFGMRWGKAIVFFVARSTAKDAAWSNASSSGTNVSNGFRSRKCSPLAGNCLRKRWEKTSYRLSVNRYQVGNKGLTAVCVLWDNPTMTLTADAKKRVVLPGAVPGDVFIYEETRRGVLLKRIYRQ